MYDVGELVNAVVHGLQYKEQLVSERECRWLVCERGTNVYRDSKEWLSRASREFEQMVKLPATFRVKRIVLVDRNVGVKVAFKRKSLGH